MLYPYLGGDREVHNFSAVPPVGRSSEGFCSVPDSHLIRIEAWREITCEHANGKVFQLSEQDQNELRLKLEVPNELEVVGWFRRSTGIRAGRVRSSGISR